MFDARFVENDVSLKSNPALQFLRPSLRFAQKLSLVLTYGFLQFLVFHGALWLF